MPEYFCSQCRKSFSAGSDETGTDAPVVCPVCHTACSGGNTVMETRLAPGTDFCSYRIIRHLGVERHAVSRYLAEQISIERKVELKIMDTAVADQSEIEFFQEEARISVRFSHPNIISAMEAGSFGQFRFIAMQHAEGLSIAASLRNGKLFTPEEAIKCILPAADALKTIWNKQKLFHGYLTPSSIVISKDNDPFLLNFETASVYGENPFEISDLELTSASFFSPEQAQFRELFWTTDQYSLGAILYNMTSGMLPYQAESAAELKKKITAGAFPVPRRPSGESMPQDFVNLIRRMTEPDTQNRFESWEAFIEEARGVEVLLRMMPVKASVPIQQAVPRTASQGAAPAAKPTAWISKGKGIPDQDKTVPSSVNWKTISRIGISVLILVSLVAFLYYQSVKTTYESIGFSLKIVEEHCSGIKYHPNAAGIIRSAENAAQEIKLPFLVFPNLWKLRKEEPLKTRIGMEEQKQINRLNRQINWFRKQCRQDLAGKGIFLNTAGTEFSILEQTNGKDDDFSGTIKFMRDINKNLETAAFSFQNFKEEAATLKKDFLSFQNTVKRAVREYRNRREQLSVREQKSLSGLYEQELAFRKQIYKELAGKGIHFKAGEPGKEQYEVRLKKGEKKNNFSSVLASLNSFKNKINETSFSTPDVRSKKDSLMQRFLVFQDCVRKAVSEYNEQYEKVNRKKFSPAEMIKIFRPSASVPGKTKQEVKKPEVKNQEPEKKASSPAEKILAQTPQKKDDKALGFQIDRLPRGILHDFVLSFLRVPLNSNSKSVEVNGTHILSVYKGLLNHRALRNMDENRKESLKKFILKLNEIQTKAETMYTALSHSGEQFRGCGLYYQKKENKLWRIKRGTVILRPSGFNLALTEMGRYNLQDLCNYAVEHDEKLRPYQFAFLVKIYAFDAAGKVAESRQDQEFLTVLKANFPDTAYLPDLHQYLLADRSNLPGSMYTKEQKTELKRMDRNKYASENLRKRSMPKYSPGRIKRTQLYRPTYKKGSKK